MDNAKSKGPSGCAEPARGVITPDAEQPADWTPPGTQDKARQEARMKPLVGYEAPDFETNGYIDGGYGNVKLSDYRGKWIVLCFYPGDFTFV